MTKPDDKSALIIPKDNLVRGLHKLDEKGLITAKAGAEPLKSLSKGVRQKAIMASTVDESDESKVEGENRKILSPEQKEKLLSALEARFYQNMHRHQGIDWSTVAQRLQEANPEKLWSLNEMERTGGEPDVVDFNNKTGQFKFEDRATESPEGRRNCVYDKAGEDYFKKHYPNRVFNGNAVDMATAMGINMLSKAEYEAAQKVDKLDRTTWSWVNTPLEVREKGVALNAAPYGNGVSVLGAHPYLCDHVRAFRGALWV